MNTLEIKPGERVKDVRITEDTLSVDLADIAFQFKPKPTWTKSC